jgi:hypothetical protein
MEMKITLFWDVLLFVIVDIFHLEDVSTSSFERLVNTYQTIRRRIPEVINVHNNCRENPRSHKMIIICFRRSSEHLLGRNENGAVGELSFRPHLLQLKLL